MHTLLEPFEVYPLPPTLLPTPRPDNHTFPQLFAIIQPYDQESWLKRETKKYNMEVSVGKGLSLGAVITLMIILDASRGGATGASVTDFNRSGRFATIAANMELEFLMDSEIGRMLATDN
ncbi:hypothetical protein CRYUN_Cryun01aG0113000 [Craigia yunnanensis]